jgi:hypothetical protein
LAVDLHLSERPTAEWLGGAHHLEQQPGDPAAAVDGAGDGAYPTATIGVDHDVASEQLLESFQVAASKRGHEAVGQLLTPFG